MTEHSGDMIGFHFYMVLSELNLPLLSSLSILLCVVVAYILGVILSLGVPKSATVHGTGMIIYIQESKYRSILPASPQLTYCWQNSAMVKVPPDNLATGPDGWAVGELIGRQNTHSQKQPFNHENGTLVEPSVWRFNTKMVMMMMVMMKLI